MPSRLKLRSKLLLALLLTGVLMQGTVPLTNERVRRLGDMLKCQCGCQASITGCNMINCHFSDPVRRELLRLIDSGASDDNILSAIQTAYGKEIMLKPPSDTAFYLMGWAMPFAVLAGGLGLLYLVLQGYRKRRPLTAAGTDAVPEVSPDLAKYQARIDKDLSDLE
jgi:cytochrome c-type biogenesis protein CcmH/NrfF